MLYCHPANILVLWQEAMEVLSFCLVVLATALVLWFLNLTATSKDRRKPKKHLPPGPWTLPIIGSLHHIVSLLPHRTLMDLSRRHGPLMFLRFGEVPTVVVSSAEAAELVMKTNDLMFATRPRGVTQDIVGCGGIGIIWGPYGDQWRQMRKICIVELLSAKQVKRMESIRTEEVAHLLRSAAAASPGAVNVSEKVTALSSDIFARAVFGGRCVRQGEFLRELDEVIALLGGFSVVDLFPSSRLVRWLSSAERDMKRSYGRIQRIIADIVEDRKAERAADRGACSVDEEDLLDVLLRLQEEDSLTFPLTMETIGVVIFDLFSAASETSSTTLEWAMSELLHNPEALAKAQLEVRQALGPERAVIANADLDKLHYMRMVIKEAFRLHPPAPLLVPRETREDCEIMGYDIPKGTNVFVNAFAISRDPTSWDNPKEYKPDRFQDNNVDYKGAHFEFTPFGAGRRQCPGILFGTSTIEIALANLLYHFDWVLPNGMSPGSLDMSEKFGITVGRRSDLHMRVVPYVASKAV